jgi:hypothetical protein
MSLDNNKLIKLLGAALQSFTIVTIKLMAHSFATGITTPIIGPPMAGASGGTNRYESQK